MALENKMKKQRKTRVVNNAYVDIDSVTIEPGQDYCNWIAVTKEKLKERERKLLGIKIDEIKVIVNRTLADCISTTYVISEELIAAIFTSLYAVIDKWTGVTMSRCKKKIITFRDYFVIGKNWWDLAKKKLLATTLWLTILHHIENYIETASQSTTSHGTGSGETMINVIRELFHGTIKYSNTKQQSLINGGTVIGCHASELQQYLLKLHAALNINKLIIDEKDTNFDHQDRYKSFTHCIMNKLRSILDRIVNQNGRQHEINENLMGNNQQYTDTAAVATQNSVNWTINPDIYSNTINALNNYNVNQLASPINNNNVVILTRNGYGGYHGVTYSVLNSRFTPMTGIPVYQYLTVPVSSNSISFQ